MYITDTVNSLPTHIVGWGERAKKGRGPSSQPKIRICTAHGKGGGGGGGTQQHLPGNFQDIWILQ